MVRAGKVRHRGVRGGHGRRIRRHQRDPLPGGGGAHQHRSGSHSGAGRYGGADRRHQVRHHQARLPCRPVPLRALRAGGGGGALPRRRRAADRGGFRCHPVRQRFAGRAGVSLRCIPVTASAPVGRTPAAQRGGGSHHRGGSAAAGLAHQRGRCAAGLGLCHMAGSVPGGAPPPCGDPGRRAQPPVHGIAGSGHPGVPAGSAGGGAHRRTGRQGLRADVRCPRAAGRPLHHRNAP